MSENKEKIVFHQNMKLFGVSIPKGTFVRQKEWVGLTDQEVFVISNQFTVTHICHTNGDTTYLSKDIDEIGMARAIEAKLKEKNT